MKTSVKILALLLVANSLFGCSTLFDRSAVSVKKLIWLEREGMFDPEVPTSEVHSLLINGLYHKDPEIVACSISAIFWYDRISDTIEVLGNSRPIDRQLAEIPGIYDLFVGIWEEGWTESGGIMPIVPMSPVVWMDRVSNRTDCIVSHGDAVWTTLMSPLVLMFPGDEKVHEIVWSQMPQVNPNGLLRLLREGQFDSPNCQQYRIDILTNPDTSEMNATLAAESLGEFRSDEGLDALVRVLQDIDHEYITKTMTVVTSIMKYEEDGVPHIALMRQTLDRVQTDNMTDRNRKQGLQDELDWFEEDYADEAGGATN